MDPNDQRLKTPSLPLKGIKRPTSSSASPRRSRTPALLGAAARTVSQSPNPSHSRPTNPLFAGATAAAAAANPSRNSPPRQQLPNANRPLPLLGASRSPSGAAAPPASQPGPRPNMTGAFPGREARPPPADPMGLRSVGREEMFRQHLAILRGNLQGRGGGGGGRGAGSGARAGAAGAAASTPLAKIPSLGPETTGTDKPLTTRSSRVKPPQRQTGQHLHSLGTSVAGPRPGPDRTTNPSFGTGTRSALSGRASQALACAAGTGPLQDLNNKIEAARINCHRVSEDLLRLAMEDPRDEHMVRLTETLVSFAQEELGKLQERKSLMDAQERGSGRGRR